MFIVKITFIYRIDLKRLAINTLQAPPPENLIEIELPHRNIIPAITFGILNNAHQKIQFQQFHTALQVFVPFCGRLISRLLPNGRVRAVESGDRLSWQVADMKSYVSRFGDVFLHNVFTRGNILIWQPESHTRFSVTSARFLSDALLLFKLIPFFADKAVYPPGNRQEQKDEGLHPEGIFLIANISNQDCLYKKKVHIDLRG
jgi:hypothetical protein